MTASSLPTLHIASQPPVSLEWGRVIKILDAGNHHPLLCHLETEGGPAGLWVVKPYDVFSTGNRRDGAINIISELAGSEVAVLAGIPSPQPGLIRFPEVPQAAIYDGVAEKHRIEVQTLFGMNRGKLAFCCAYLSDSPDLDPDAIAGPYGKALTQQWGATMMAFDAYIRHDDRRTTNPNALVFSDAVVALDHGAAFVGIDRRGVTGRALAQQTVLHAATSFRDHVFFAPVRKWHSEIDWGGVCDRLKRAGPEQIRAASSWWPVELEPHRSQVISFLLERPGHVDTIVESVARFTR